MMTMKRGVEEDFGWRNVVRVTHDSQQLYRVIEKVNHCMIDLSLTLKRSISIYIWILHSVYLGSSLFLFVYRFCGILSLGYQSWHFALFGHSSRNGEKG
jgi:hypothetical protein